MLIAFELSMPHVGSWNGRWTGEDRLYARVVNFTNRYGTSKASKDKANSILEKENYHYNFGDGWGANIEVKVVSASQATKIRKKVKKDFVAMTG